MKRMKNLLALVMAVVMVLALGIPAFAAGETITILNPKGHGYAFAKIFDAEVDGTEVTYHATEDQMKAITGQLTGVTGAFADLTFIYDEGTTSPKTYTVQKSATYGAADFAKWLKDNEAVLFKGNDAPFKYEQDTNSPQNGIDNNEWVTQNDVNDPTERITYSVDGKPGYWFIIWDNGEPYALTTVLPNGHSDVQNKKDIPFDKDVYRYDNNQTSKFDKMNDDGTYSAVAAPDFHDGLDDSAYSWDRDSVQQGDKLHYVVTLNVPDVSLNQSVFYEVWDVLSAGQTYATDPNSLHVWVQRFVEDATGSVVLNPGTPEEKTGKYVYTDIIGLDLGKVTDYTKTLGEDQYKTQASDGSDDQEIWRIRFDFLKHVKNGDYLHDTPIYIEYDAIVTEDVGVIDNTAHSHYLFDDFEEYKEAQTQNYDAQIVVDKYETGNASQKLEGAEFVLYRLATQDDVDGNIATAVGKKLYYQVKNNKVTWLEIADNVDLTTRAVDTVNDTTTDITKKVTNAEGIAKFVGLEDGTYYLYEIKAPTGYVRLEQPVPVTVNGKASLDPSLAVDNDDDLTAAAQVAKLSAEANVANTPGSVLPSTGGRGTTMLYMAGLGMMLAAGAFLIFRRRAEAGK